VDLLETVADQPEGFAEALLQGALELLVDRLAHLLEALAVVGLEVLEPALDGLSQPVDGLLVAGGEPRELLGEGVELALLRGGELSHALQDRVREPLHGARRFFARLPCGVAELLAVSRHLVAYRVLATVLAGLDQRQAFAERDDLGLRIATQQRDQQREHDEQQGDRGCEQGFYEGHGFGGMLAEATRDSHLAAGVTPGAPISTTTWRAPVAVRGRRTIVGKSVLVTGATGHLGYNLVRHLRDHGYAVRAGVRNSADRVRNAPLIDLGVELVDADLDRPDTLAAAAEGVEGVFQVAAVVQFWAKDPEREIIEPSVNGGLNVLEAARAAGVKRVVFTSSLAAIGIHSTEENPLTEDDWNQNPLTAYAVAKTRAERRAWEFAEQHGLDMVVINPTTIIGPGVYRHTPITLMMDMVLRGWVPFVLPSDTSYVDARDIASGMRLAFENPDASGRYLLSADFVPMVELMRLMEEGVPGVRTPRRVFPLKLLPLLVAGDYLAAKLLKWDRQITREMLPEFAGKTMYCSSAKAIGELGWSPRAISDSVADTVRWIQRQFLNGD